MHKTIHLGVSINWETLFDLTDCSIVVALDSDAKNRIEIAHNYLQEKIKRTNMPIYGINTGFGSLCNVAIAPNKLTELQVNLMRSHACGTGSEIEQHLVRLMLILKIQSLAYGHSGVQLATVNRLIDFVNNGVYPQVFEQGSLGASGDLAPLAHLCLPIIGEGMVYVNNQLMQASELQNLFGWQPIQLSAKEGLALLNGTQFMSALGCWSVMQAEKIWQKAHFTAALSFDGFGCTLEPFNALIHQIRPHEGQIKSAQLMLNYLKNSQLAISEKQQVQDPYSFRCIPQVHGASWQAISHVKQVLLTEINAVTDNPNIFPEQDQILSGGNFHGQPLAIAFDYLAIAIAELGSISERRTYLLISGQRNLPPFLTPEPGINSGFMIPQYTAASIVSQNKQLCSPASVDSIVSSNGQEDHVSMGANGATRLLKIIENVWQILGIEWATAAQAIQFKGGSTKSNPAIFLSDELKTALVIYRENVAFQNKDSYFHDILIYSKKFLQKY